MSSICRQFLIGLRAGVLTVALERVSTICIPQP